MARINVLGVTEYAGKFFECYGTGRGKRRRVVCRPVDMNVPSKAHISKYPESVRNSDAFLRAKRKVKDQWHFIAGLDGARRRRLGR